MKIPQIRMESQFAKIHIERTDAKLEMEHELPEMYIEQPQADISIRTVPGKLTIDQTQAVADMNLMSIMKRNDEYARESLEKLQQAIVKKAQEGKELMQIERGTNVIAEQAKRKVNPPLKQLGITFIPSHFSVKVNYEPAEVHIDAVPQRPIIRADIRPLQFTYHPGHVETKLAQRNEVKITVVEPE